MKHIISLLLAFLFTSQIYSFTDYWVEQTSGVTVQLTSVSIPLSSSNTAWICGYSGTVLRTVSNGQLWTNVGAGIPPATQLISISGIDANNAITAGYVGTNTFLYRTTNAGANWTQVLTQTNGFFDAVCMTSATNGFLAGDPVNSRWSLWKTTNGGANWDSTGLYLPAANATEAGWNNSLFCFQNRIWLGTNNFRVYYSSNAGLSWTPQSTGSEINSYAVWMFGASNFNDGLTGGTTLLITSNGGTNWANLTSTGTGNFSGFAGNGIPVDAMLNLVWYVRGDNKIYFSFTGGTGWQVDHTAPGSGTYRYISGGNGYGPFYAVRTDGGISYHVPIVGIQPVSSEIPKTFSLSQNYPNPFNPETKINFQIAKSSFTTLTIYDELGRKVKSLVNEQLNAGTYEVNWNANNNSSGMYFYRLETGGFTQTKKMLLIK